MTPIETHRFTPGRLPDFLAFFDGDVFADNPRWASCYCQCFYEDHSKVVWTSRTATENRAEACRRGASHEMRGVLAYVDGAPVGWCNAAPRRLVHALDDEPIEDADTTGAIVCFVVHPRFRRRGVAAALLAAACDSLRDDGMRRVEANPRPAGTSDAEQHFGPLSLYLAAGFTVDRHDDDGSVWVQKRL